MKRFAKGPGGIVAIDCSGYTHGVFLKQFAIACDSQPGFLCFHGRRAGVARRLPLGVLTKGYSACGLTKGYLPLAVLRE